MTRLSSERISELARKYSGDADLVTALLQGAELERAREHAATGLSLVPGASRPVSEPSPGVPTFDKDLARVSTIVMSSGELLQMAGKIPAVNDNIPGFGKIVKLTDPDGRGNRTVEYIPGFVQTVTLNK